MEYWWAYSNRMCHPLNLLLCDRCCTSNGILNSREKRVLDIFSWLGGAYMRLLVGSIASLNALDALFTYVGVTKGWVEEANPIMASLLDFHPSLFLLVKLGIAGVILFIFLHPSLEKRFRPSFKKMLRLPLQFVCILYVGVFLHHIVWVYLYFIYAVWAFSSGR